MTYKVDENLNEFEPWGGAEETRSIIWAYDDEHGTNHWDEVCQFAEDLFNEGEDATATDINDWLAFSVPEDTEASWAEVFAE